MKVDNYRTRLRDSSKRLQSSSPPKFITGLDTTALFLRCSHQSPTIRTLLDHNSVNRLVIQLPPHYLDGIADVPSTQFRTLPPVQIPILEPFIHFVSMHTNLSQFYLNWRYLFRILDYLRFKDLTEDTGKPIYSELF